MAAPVRQFLLWSKFSPFSSNFGRVYCSPCSEALRWSDYAVSRREFGLSMTNRLKEINVHTEGDTTKVSADYVKSNRIDHLVKKADPHQSCPICRLGDINIKYTDVLILAQFVRSDGEMLAQSVTGLCTKQHRIIRQRVRQAQSAGLMPSRRPDTTHPDDVTPILDKQLNEGNFQIYHETWNKKKIPHFPGHEVPRHTRR